METSYEYQTRGDRSGYGIDFLLSLIWICDGNFGERSIGRKESGWAWWWFWGAGWYEEAQSYISQDTKGTQRNHSLDSTYMCEKQLKLFGQSALLVKARTTSHTFFEDLHIGCFSAWIELIRIYALIRIDALIRMDALFRIDALIRMDALIRIDALIRMDALIRIDAFIIE